LQNFVNLPSPPGSNTQFYSCWLPWHACLLALPARADDRRVEKRVPPFYPEIAKRMHISGIVHVEATVAPDGSVTAAKATIGNKMLSLAAEDAVKRWKFIPGNSQSILSIDINFEEAN
jgi:TonB family protein